MRLLDALRERLGRGDGEPAFVDVGGERNGSDSRDGEPRDDGDVAGDSGRPDASEDDQYSPAEFREHAADLVDRLDDDALDYSADSLDALDDHVAVESDRIGAVADELDGEDELVEQVHAAHTLEYGSYFGEVLVRSFGGVWERGEDTWQVVTAAGGREVRVAVFDAAAQALAGSLQFADVVADLAESLEDAAPGGSAIDFEE